MSGHSKWSQIKHRKGIADQKKGQVFSKLANKITIAVKHGVDPANNYRLQSAIDEARAANVPKENIDRAIKRATEKDSANIEEIILQAMGPAGIAVVIEAITDNKNRTINEIRHILAEHEFKMVPEGSLSWAFEPNWVPVSPIEPETEAKEKLDKLLLALGENEDVENVHTNLR